MPYNGSGTFNRVYSWVQDALNGLFISSTRMDTEMDGFATGLTNCVTRDGQSPALANIPMNSFKLTGLADGTAATDSVAYNQVTGAISLTTGGWVLESSVSAFATATTFTLVGDQSARYVTGRRVKATVTGPPTAWYGTVVSSSFGGGFTTVVVAKDTFPIASASLDAGFANLYRSNIAADYPSLPRYTDVIFSLTSVATPSATPTQITPISGSAVHDTFSETSGGTFTAKLAGIYIFSGVIVYQNANTYSSGIFTSGYKLNGGAYVPVVNGLAVNAGVGLGFMFTPFYYALTLAANDALTFWVMPGTYSAGSAAAGIFPMNIRRLA